MQLINEHFGGIVLPEVKTEYGPTEIDIIAPCPLTDGMDKKQTVLMSHGDAVKKHADGFVTFAVTGDVVAGIYNAEKKIIGVQFHPEVDLSEHGVEMLKNFLRKVCGLKETYALEDRIETSVRMIREKVGNEKVIVLVSGGVDSAACVLLLQKQGYDVSGVTLRLHHYKDRPGTCGSADDIEEAARVAAQMGISHRVLDLCDLFRREVMGHFVSEYCAGRTPNPCLDCNRELKFGTMLDWALDHGFDYISTGHYARVGFDAASGRHLLLRGVDAHKDQSYVLYQMTQRQLAHLLLPVGEYSKPEIRALAADFGLENAQKPDSQDICFVPDGDYVRFLREFGGVTPEPGDFVDTSGRVLGRHRGLVAYTAGQRKGLGVSADRPLYVLSKDAKHNTVLLGDDAELFSSALLASRVNWIITPPAEPLRVTAKTRYSQRESAATVTPLDGGAVRVDFDEPQRAITAGQAVVFYRGDVVVGGATIDKAL